MRRAVALALGTLILLTTVACGAGPATPIPTDTLSPSTKPTVAEATPPLPTPATPRTYPTATRTGFPELDRVLDAVFSGNPAQLRALFEPTPSPCVANPQGIHDPPACPEGTAAGTLLPVFRAMAGEAVWPEHLDSALPAWLRGRHEVYAIYRDVPPAINGWIPAAEYAIALVDLDMSPMFASEVRVSGGRVTGFIFGGSLGVERYTEGVSLDRFVLPPR